MTRTPDHPMNSIEAESRRQLLSVIPTEVMRSLKKLHRREPWWNLMCLVYPGLWLTCAVVMQRYPGWPVRVAGVLVIGISIQALGILMHEALHRNLFRQARLDRWAAFVCGVVVFFSGTAYKVAHLNHHGHTRTSLDQDEISNLCRTEAQYRLFFYVWAVAGTFLYFFIVPYKALSIAKAPERARIVSEYAAMAAIYVLVVVACAAMGHASWLLWYWLLPAQVGLLLSNVRGLSEHLCTLPGSGLLSTRTTTSTKVVSFLMCNLNYHLEHHLFPGIPWYNLPKAHQLLLPSYSRMGVHIQRSYLGYLIQALRGGPFQHIRESMEAVT
jgi:fatty acid desaturase